MTPSPKRISLEAPVKHSTIPMDDKIEKFLTSPSTMLISPQKERKNPAKNKIPNILFSFIFDFR